MVANIYNRPSLESVFYDLIRAFVSANKITFEVILIYWNSNGL